MLYSPVRCSVVSSVLPHQIPVAQLACVKHAASVRPEPGSNSQLITFFTKIHFACYLCTVFCYQVSGPVLKTTFFFSDLAVALRHNAG